MFSLAFAEGVNTAQQGSILSFVPIIVLIFVFYFFIIRPQQKKLKQENEMRSKIRIGDKIITNSGIFGSVSQIDDTKNVVLIEISKGVNITIYKNAIAEILIEKNLQNEKSA